MIYIAHRGLTDGPDANLENRPEQILKSLSEGYDCEIDLWSIDSELFLGHDFADYLIKPDFLNNKGLWIHAKNLSALYWLTKNGKNLNYFWHQNDDFVVTSKGYIWTYPGKDLTWNSICVMPEWNTTKESLVNFDQNCYGVCSDYVGLMNKNI